MNEQKLIKKQFIKHIINNIIILSTILVVFGISMFFLTKMVVYNSVDIELYETAEFLNKIAEELNIKEDVFLKINKKIVKSKVYEITSKINNPKIICIIRDENGNIIDTGSLWNNYEDYIYEIRFSKNKIEEIYEVSIDDEYYYRAINIRLGEKDSKNTSGYVQLLMNVDGERYLINNYFEVIVYSTLVGIVIVFIASIIMARNTLEPIGKMLKKQNEFVQNVSHELRTPITIIQAKQELLLQEPNAKIIDKIEEISLTLNETKRLGKLIKDLLLLSRADNKQIEIVKEEVEVDEFIGNLIKPYQEIIEMDNKKLIQNLNCKKIASIDVNKMHQVMVILLDNAMKYTEQGDTIEIVTSFKDNRCIIEVRDTGIGISDESINRVFERFYREDKARNRETGGTGLGLSIADMIVSAHSGTIKASHNDTKGTIFTIKLPR